MEHFYLGLDNGGTTTKAAIFDRCGHEIGVFGLNTTAFHTAPGFAEQDMEKMWQTNCTAIRSVLKETGIAPKNIAGVGICGHGKGLYLWGKNQKPARCGILSADNRAYAYQEKWIADGIEQKAFALSCQHIMACQPACLLAWIRDHEPEVYENIQWIFGCKDYIRFRLTNNSRAEITDCSGSGLMNLYTKQYDVQLLQMFGLSQIRQALPEICGSMDLCGFVTNEAAKECGLCVGTPVIGGMFDIDACALGTQVMEPGIVCMIAGTWSINGYLQELPVVDGSVLMNSVFCANPYYLIEESSPTSAGNNAWFIQQLLPELEQQAKQQGQSIYEVLNLWVEEIPPETFVPVFLPFLMASNVHPNARGAFVGLGTNHSRKHLARSVYEGITFSHKYHFERLLTTMNDPLKMIRLAGGAAHSPVWTQMFADVLGYPVQTVQANETGALGCAIAVATAVGDYQSLTKAAAAMSRLSEPVYPDVSRKQIYERKYKLYLKTIECLDGLWTDMQTLIEEG